MEYIHVNIRIDTGSYTSVSVYRLCNESQPWYSGHMNMVLPEPRHANLPPQGIPNHKWSWPGTHAFHYEPPEFSPSGKRVKRPDHWHSTNSKASWPPGYVFNEEGEQVCGYWNFRAEKVCKNNSLHPNGRCRFHGGKSPRGPANAAWVDGRTQRKSNRYSAYMPERLLEKYEASEVDPELLSMRGEMALVTARISEILEKVDQGEAGALWFELRELAAEYRDSRDQDERSDLLSKMLATIDQGAQDYMAWQEAASLAETRRKLSETEQKRMVALQQYITAEQATMLIATLGDIVSRNIHDPAILANIRVELAGALTGGSGVPYRPSPSAAILTR